MAAFIPDQISALWCAAYGRRLFVFSLLEHKHPYSGCLTVRCSDLTVFHWTSPEVYIKYAVTVESKNKPLVQRYNLVSLFSMNVFSIHAVVFCNAEIRFLKVKTQKKPKLWKRCLLCFVKLFTKCSQSLLMFFSCIFGRDLMQKLHKKFLLLKFRVLVRNILPQILDFAFYSLPIDKWNIVTSYLQSSILNSRKNSSKNLTTIAVKACFHF